MACGTDCGYPNVRIAGKARSRLQERAEEGRLEADRRGAAEQISKLEELAGATQAVVNVGAAFAHQLLADGNSAYSNYAKLVDAGVRRTAHFENDCDRRTVEAKLYGSSAGNVVYAALSSDGRGLSGYGCVTLRLRDKLIEKRATVLEENSYAFMARHSAGFFAAIPDGYSGVWGDRALVVVAKLGPKCEADHNERDLHLLILSSDGVRQRERFLEVHIWGPFNAQTVASIRSDHVSGEPDEDATLLELSKEKALRRNIPWEPVP